MGCCGGQDWLVEVVARNAGVVKASGDSLAWKRNSQKGRVISRVVKGLILSKVKQQLSPLTNTVHALTHCLQLPSGPSFSWVSSFMCRATGSKQIGSKQRPHDSAGAAADLQLG
jgi:hypothetical protein